METYGSPSLTYLLFDPFPEKKKKILKPGPEDNGTLCKDRLNSTRLTPLHQKAYTNLCLSGCLYLLPKPVFQAMSQILGSKKPSTEQSELAPYIGDWCCQLDENWVFNM